MFFYIHLETPSGRRSAFTSLEFDDLERAYLDACASLPDLAYDLLAEGIDPTRCELTICNIENEALLKVQFSDIIRSKGQSVSRPQTIIAQLRETDFRAQMAKTALADTITDSRALIEESKRLISQLSEWNDAIRNDS